jgi:allantoinase
MTRAFTSTRIVTLEGTRPGALLVDGASIRGVCLPSEVPLDAESHPCGSYAIVPGLVDTHVHINEPGRTEWEGFHTATRAAAAGGYTTLVDMPLNCLPETTTVEALEEKRGAARGKCFVDWAAWGGAVDGNQRHILPLAQAGVPGFKCFLIYPGCDGFTMIDRGQLEAALPAIAASGLPLLVHAELAGPIDDASALLQSAGADWTSYATYLASRPDQAELDAIHLLLDLCRQYRFRLHIVHLSTVQALPALAQARAEGLPITVETCPHYLHFAAEEIPDGATLYKCAPPIRSRANREALWQALAGGTLDLVATDHSPCPPERKRTDTGRFDQAWGGIASLSVALPVMHTECRRRGHSLDDLVRWMSAAPAVLAGMSDRAGALLPGRDANFVLFDTEAQSTVAPEHLHTRHAISPYVGETLTGQVRTTYLRGEPVWDGSRFENLPRGREVKLC